MLLLIVLAVMSVLHCDLPLSLAWPAAIITAASGAACLWRRGQRRVHECLIANQLATCRIDGQPVSHLDLRWRGPLLFLRWKGPGQRRWQHFVFWPDTLSADKRREVRLATPINRDFTSTKRLSLEVS